MHKPFYASGFLFHLPSQQILLQLTSDAAPKLQLFGKKSQNGHSPQTIFQLCIEESLGVSISPSSIYPVYDYIEDSRNEHFVFYADVVDLLTPKETAKWLLLAKLSKFAMTEQTRHDIIIGERVIRSRLEGARPPAIHQ